MTSYFVCGHNILTEGVFITQLSSKAGNLEFDELCGARQKSLFLERNV
jgi:hypothetical protein